VGSISLFIKLQRASYLEHSHPRLHLRLNLVALQQVSERLPRTLGTILMSYRAIAIFPWDMMVTAAQA